MGNSDLLMLLAGSAASSLVLTVTVIHGAKWCRRLFRASGVRVHEWTYQNPANRTCRHCGLCQHQYERNVHGLLNPLNPHRREDQYTPPSEDQRCLW